MQLKVDINNKSYTSKNIINLFFEICNHFRNI